MDDADGFEADADDALEGVDDVARVVVLAAPVVCVVHDAALLVRGDGVAFHDPLDGGFAVDGVVVELGEADALAGEAVFFDGVAQFGVPLVRGGDDHAAGKVDAAVFSPVHADAGVVGAEVFEAEDVLRGVTFALDGAVVSAGGFLGDEVDALILPSVAVGPVHPEPYL